ncbi:hypothetical protein V5799_020089 [Amblyomma americanum]|uniref:Uncharacterized protein n=1 Tax=Amblyomma americanum TaxID=6943 RepID=A0AAQ4EV25_AMBAM
MALEYASPHPVAGALEAAGSRGCQAACASCGRQASCKASQLLCFLPPAKTSPVCPWRRYQGRADCSRQRRALHLMVPPDEEELEEEGTPCDTASTQEQPAVVAGRPSQQQRSTRTEEVHQLLAETRRTNDLLAARNVEDIAFHARLLEFETYA